MEKQKKYIEIKQKRRQSKKTEKRNASYQEVIYIFEKVLEGWKTIKIYNTIIQNDPSSTILKKNVENIIYFYLFYFFPIDRLKSRYASPGSHRCPPHISLNPFFLGLIIFRGPLEKVRGLMIYIHTKMSEE